MIGLYARQSIIFEPEIKRPLTSAIEKAMCHAGMFRISWVGKFSNRPKSFLKRGERHVCLKCHLHATIDFLSQLKGGLLPNAMLLISLVSAAVLVRFVS